MSGFVCESPALVYGFVGSADFSPTPDLYWTGSLPKSFTGHAVTPAGGGFCGVATSPIDGSISEELSIVADTRLHNREELRATLVPDRPWASDAELVLAAYRKWGKDCPRRLEGEFAFAIWDSRHRRLFACRDHLGNRLFCYRIDGSRIRFGSSVAAILRIQGTARRLNRRKLAGMASYLGHYLYPDETLYEGITVLGASRCLIVDEVGHRVECYWEPQLDSAAVPRNPIEAFRELRRLLFEAVERRLDDGDVACALSGGLDSSSVAVVAAAILGQRGRRLHCYGGVVPQEHRLAVRDEREFIDAVRDFADIDLEYVSPAPDKGPFDTIDRPADWGDLSALSSRDFLRSCFEDFAVRDRVSVILEGSAGELGPSCEGTQYFSELALGFRWATLARCLAEFGATEGRRPYRRVFGEIAAALPGRGWKGSLSAFFTPEFQAESKFWVAPSRSFSQQGDQLQWIRMHVDGLPRTSRTRRGLVGTSSPLTDKPILEFCLSAPPELKVRNGYRRFLIRGALEGLLPPKVLWRTSSAPYSPDYFIRYNSQLSKAREFVASIGPYDPVRALIDIPKLAEMLQPVPPGVRSFVARVTVPRSIYMILFLRQFPEFRA